MPVAANKRCSALAEKIVSIANAETTPQKALTVLGSAIRRAQTDKRRAEVVVKQLSEVAVKMMENLGLEEIRVTHRTFLRLDRTFKLPGDDKGQSIVDKLVAGYGQGFVDSLYSREEVTIPASIVVSFQLDEKALAALEPEVRREVGKIIGKPKLFIGDVPQRAKKGKARKRR